MNVTHKPFGMENRKVRCIRCGIRGHQSGDRECKLRFQNPNGKIMINRIIMDVLLNGNIEFV